MKTNPFLILLLLFLSCSNNTQTDEASEIKNSVLNEKENSTLTKIAASVKNAEGKNYFLYNLGGSQPQKIDSATFNEDEINFTCLLSEEFNILGLGENQQNLLLFIAKKGDEISVNSEYGINDFNYSVDGSENSVLLKDYLNKRLATINQINEVQKKLNLLPFEAQQKREELMNQAKAIKTEFDTIKKDFILNNRNSPSIFIALYDITNFIEEKKLLEIVAESISKHFPNTAFHEASILTMNKANQQIEMQKQQKLMLEKQQEEMLNAGIAIGKPAPELNFPDQNGNLIALSSLKGKVVLLDFWASWCGPCRKENPFVVSLYNKYKNKGFDIYSFSLDNNKPKWIQAIAHDGLIWNNHVSDLKGWQSEGAAKYLIRSIPQTFLIDRNGKIAEIGLRGSELEQKIIELL